MAQQTCEKFEILILRGVVSQNHIHILCSVTPNISPAEIMLSVKGRVSRKIFEEFPHLKRLCPL
ncbi:transposase [Desulfobacter hydrogenophilus]|uniref:transposase n=1 Tax=Desulfobacter hydrogenophilus TaxID=2291 RepID=UPI003BF8BA96